MTDGPAKPDPGRKPLTPAAQRALAEAQRTGRLSAGARNRDRFLSELEGVTVVNLHIDGTREQFDRVLSLAPERSIVAGDANLVSPVADGFSQPLAGSIDQILVRGLELRDGPSAWPLERRIVDGRVLSDHAPVEVVVE